jgi:hypothetical protein
MFSNVQKLFSKMKKARKAAPNLNAMAEAHKNSLKLGAKKQAKSAKTAAKKAEYIKNTPAVGDYLKQNIAATRKAGSPAAKKRLQMQRKLQMEQTKTKNTLAKADAFMKRKR